MIESERHQGYLTTQESHYYITTLASEAKIAAEAVRAHWGIENKLHWVLDVTFCEDDSRIRRGNAPKNFNTLRQFSLNLIKRARSNTSVKQSRLRAAWNDSFRFEVLSQQ